MPGYYAVVQYLPDPVSGEKVNIGVLAYGDGRIRARFLRNWSRVRGFANEDIGFLREFATSISEATSRLTLPMFESQPRLTETDLADVAGRWSHSIQLTAPSASLLSPDELLRDAAARYLHEPQPARRSFRDRRHAAAVARTSMENAIERQLGHDAPRRFVRSQFNIPGRVVEHKFDVVLANGRVFSVADGLSFEVPDRSDLIRDIDATAFAIYDVKNADPTVEAAVVLLGPRTSKAYRRAETEFTALKAAVLSEREAPAWADGVAVRFASKAKLGEHDLESPLEVAEPKA